jgi:hypothetical protein
VKFDLLLQQITDPVVRENFRRLKSLIESGNLGGSGGGVGPQGPPGATGPAGPQGPPGPGADALQLTFKATTAMSALRLVKADSLTHVGLATNNSTYEAAQAIGVTLNAAGAGADVDVLLFGKLEDVFFTFPLGATLFVGTNGNITDVAPSSGFLTQIGHALGTGAIFINVEPPVSL